MKACILKADRVALDEEDDDGEQVCLSEPLENLENKSLREKERIVDDLIFETSKLRVIFILPLWPSVLDWI